MLSTEVGSSTEAGPLSMVFGEEGEFFSTGRAMAGRGLRWLLRLSNSAAISTVGPAGFASSCTSKRIQQEVQLLDVFGAVAFRGRTGSLALAETYNLTTLSAHSQVNSNTDCSTKRDNPLPKNFGFNFIRYSQSTVGETGLRSVKNLELPVRFITTKASSFAVAGSTVNNNDKDTCVIKDKEVKGEPERQEKTLDDFQHEEIVGPTVERDTSAVADELRESLEILRQRVLSFKSAVIALGCVQGLGAWWSYLTWHSLNPTWQLIPSVLVSFALAFVLRQALQPMAFFGKLEERSRLRLVTLSLMVTKGFASYFNRARILVAISAIGAGLGLLYTSSAFLLAYIGVQ